MHLRALRDGRNHLVTAGNLINSHSQQQVLFIRKHALTLIQSARATQQRKGCAAAVANNRTMLQEILRDHV